MFFNPTLKSHCHVRSFACGNPDPSGRQIFGIGHFWRVTSAKTIGCSTCPKSILMTQRFSCMLSLFSFCKICKKHLEFSGIVHVFLLLFMVPLTCHVLSVWADFGVLGQTSKQTSNGAQRQQVKRLHDVNCCRVASNCLRPRNPMMETHQSTFLVINMH